MILNSKLCDLSYYRTGGSALAIYAPSSVDELQSNIQEINEKAAPFFILGGGSNSLVMDEAWPGSVLSFHLMSQLTLENDTTILCDAGVTNETLCEFARDHNLSGLEWMYGLPGQVGGTVRMNARCYGGEISQVVSHVNWFDFKGKAFASNARAHLFQGYKKTLFMQTPSIVSRAKFLLKTGNKDDITRKMQIPKNDRVKKGQFLFPNCGCVFKNDYSPEVSVSSGLLLEKSGLKNFERNGARVSPQHGNFVYNEGTTARNILELTLLMREKVFSSFGVWLEYEMEILGEIPQDLRGAFFEKRTPQYKHEKLRELQLEFAQNR